MTAWLDPHMGHPCYGGEVYRHDYDDDGRCHDCGALDPDHEPTEETPDA